MMMMMMTTMVINHLSTYDLGSLVCSRAYSGVVSMHTQYDDYVLRYFISLCPLICQAFGTLPPPRIYHHVEPTTHRQRISASRNHTLHPPTGFSIFRACR